MSIDLVFPKKPDTCRTMPLFTFSFYECSTFTNENFYVLFYCNENPRFYNMFYIK